MPCATFCLCHNEGMMDPDRTRELAALMPVFFGNRPYRWEE